MIEQAQIDRLDAVNEKIKAKESMTEEDRKMTLNVLLMILEILT
jgi:hypothetical protein